jgi:hypothetical protein
VRFTASGQLPIVTMEVDGRGTYELLLDTGTTGTVLTPSVVEALGLKRLPPVVVNTPTGPLTLGRAELQSLELGELIRGPMPVLVSELPALRRRDRNIQGVLGLDWLSSFHYLIDYDSRTLHIGTITDIIAVTGTPVAYRNDASLILLPGERDFWLALDTAAEGLVVSEAWGLAVMRSANDLVRLDSAAGARIVKTGSLSRLDVGTVVLRDISVTLLPAAEGVTHGLLPAHLFRRLYVNHPQGYVVLDAR